ncbi:PAS domain S-box protein [Flavobacterium lacus]|uniref:histidine kinase n=1 Tax=Flavobacterium lacus TaxID=1353778 RepID=A0A328WV79_9FLAO|nr:PAS domain S-box protein [Flavobacterium lacus]RAR49026.1 PAS domain S-box-containing protein [Flavobacterium lacus]
MNTYTSNKLVSRVKIKPKLGGLLIYFLVLCFGLFIVYLRSEIIAKNRQNEMSSLLSIAQKNIQQSLNNSYTANLTLALTLDSEGKPQNFEKVSQEIIRQNPAIDLVQLVPDGVIRYVYPLEGNESVIGYNILDSSTNPIVRNEALKMIGSRKMFFAGPIELKQGGIGIIGRLPVYNNNKFWGFSAVIIRIESLIKSSGIKNIKSKQFYFQLSKINPITKKEEFFFDNKAEISASNYKVVKINDEDWKLYIIEKQKNQLLAELLPSLLLAFLLSIVSGLFAYFIFKRPAELIRLVNLQAKEIIKTESLFKTIFDKAAVGIVQICGQHQEFVTVNQHFANMLGYTTNELKSKTLTEITQKCDYILVQEKEQLLKSGKIEDYTIEIRLQAKDKREIWVNLIVSTVSSSINMAIIEDITEKKEAEHLIIETNKRLKSLFEDSPIPLWEEDYSEVKNYLTSLNLIGKSKKEVEDYINENPEVVTDCVNRIRIITMNQQSLILHEAKTPLELIENFQSMLTNESLQTVKKQIIMICKNKSSFKTTTQIKTLKGTEKYIHLQWNAISGYEESLERIIITTDDITERVITLSKLEESEKKLNELINSIDGIVWEFNQENGKFSFISDKVDHLLGYSKNEIMSNNSFWEEHIYPDDQAAVITKMKALNSKNNYLDLEYRMISSKGKIIWVRGIINYFKNKRTKNKLIRGVIININQAKQIETNLYQSLDIVTEQNRRIFNFSHIVSHNLRTHTSNIQSIINLLEITEKPKEREELLDMLKLVSSDLDDSVHHLNEITNIYTNSSIEKQKIQLKLAVESVLFNLNNIITLRKAKVKNLLSNNLIIHHNKLYLDNIIMNFFYYILKNKDLKTIPTIEVTSYLENNYVVLEIKDIGDGLNIEKTSDKIFSLFQTPENDTDINHGFGLFIAKSQIEALNGKVQVENSKNETTFKIYFK